MELWFYHNLFLGCNFYTNECMISFCILFHRIFSLTQDKYFDTAICPTVGRSWCRRIFSVLKQRGLQSSYFHCRGDIISLLVLKFLPRFKLLRCVSPLVLTKFNPSSLVCFVQLYTVCASEFGQAQHPRALHGY